MGILRNYEDGNMQGLRTISYQEVGAQTPYVTKDVNNPPNNKGLGLQVNKRVDDVSRIAQMLVDRPGLTHLTNEAILKQGELTKKLQSSKNYQAGTKVGNLIRRTGGTLKHVAQVAISTLAQVPVNGTGTHFLRAFRTDTYLQDGDPSSGFAQFFGAGGVEGAQYALRGKAVPAQGLLSDSILPTNNTTASPEDIGVAHIGIKGDISGLDKDRDKIGSFDITKVNTKSKNSTQENISNALTGSSIPLSGSNRETTASPNTLGTSNKDVQGDISELKPKTSNIFTPENTFTGTNTQKNINAIQIGADDFSRRFDGAIRVRENTNLDTVRVSSKSINQAKEEQQQYSGVNSSLKVDGGSKPLGYIQDFRSSESENEFGGRGIESYSLNYNGRFVNKETRVGLGNPGKITRNRTNYTIADIDTADKINLIDVKTEPLNGITDNRDLIQLEFQVITPEQTYYLAFRAFLDSFDDNFASSWNTHKYLGRAEDFYTYQGFSRNINIGFKIAAQSSQEMKPLYRKAATLASITAPTYGPDGRFMRGSIAKVTVGDYIYEQPGIIESVDYKWQTNYPWEISFQNPEGGERGQVLPHVLDVSLSFRVIHDFLPETGEKPFITNHRPPTENKEVYLPLEQLTEIR